MLYILVGTGIFLSISLFLYIFIGFPHRASRAARVCLRRRRNPLSLNLLSLESLVAQYEWWLPFSVSIWHWYAHHATRTTCASWARGEKLRLLTFFACIIFYLCSIPLLQDIGDDLCRGNQSVFCVECLLEWSFAPLLCLLLLIGARRTSATGGAVAVSLVIILINVTHDVLVVFFKCFVPKNVLVNGESNTRRSERTCILISLSCTFLNEYGVPGLYVRYPLGCT